MDENADQNDKFVLRLPPYHCQLNPIEHAWLSVKHYVRMNNATFKLHDVKQLLEKSVDYVTAEKWTDLIGHVLKDEEKFAKIDFSSDEILGEEEKHDERHISTIGTGNKSSDPDLD